jgi:peptide/nickel transport system permease protein
MTSIAQTRPVPVSLLTPEIPVWQRARRSLFKAKWPLLALFILGVVVFMAVFAQQIVPKDPNRQSLIERLMEPMKPNAEGKIDYFLGTDGLGRDLWSRIIYGAQISLAVGVMAVMVGGLMGTSLGIIAGYRGGRVDDIIMRLADIQLAFPFILLAIMVLVVLGPGVWNLIPVLGIGQWVTYARIARGQTISQREKEYVEAARAMGASDRRIMLQAILPNVIAPLIVIASFNVASAILAEASLSFLGLGVPPTVPTWGGILNESRDQILAGKWWPAFFPGLAIMLTVLSLNILGDWLRDFLDPRLRGRDAK